MAHDSLDLEMKERIELGHFDMEAVVWNAQTCSAHKWCFLEARCTETTIIILTEAKLTWEVLQLIRQKGKRTIMENSSRDIAIIWDSAVWSYGECGVDTSHALGITLLREGTPVSMMGVHLSCNPTTRRRQMEHIKQTKGVYDLIAGDFNNVTHSADAANGRGESGLERKTLENFLEGWKDVWRTNPMGGRYTHYPNQQQDTTPTSSRTNGKGRVVASTGLTLDRAGRRSAATGELRVCPTMQPWKYG